MRSVAGVVRFFAWLGIALLTLEGAGCAAPGAMAQPAIPSGAPHVSELDFHCARATMDKASPYRMPLAGKEEDPELAGLLADVPYRARRAALAAGLEPLLARLLHEKSANPEPDVRQLVLQDELMLRIMAFDAQVSAAAFEAGCTADMIQKELAELGHREQSRQLSIAVASLLVGAVGGTAAGAWTLADADSKGPTILGIAASLATGALGAMALSHDESAIAFSHPRNRLAPVWHGSDPDHLYPSFVFRMLTFPDESNGKAPREELVEAWQKQLDDAVPAEQRAHALEVLLGDGGAYGETLLSLRAEMFHNLESAVQGEARDLELLNRYLVRSLTSPLPGESLSPPKL